MGNIFAFYSQKVYVMFKAIVVSLEFYFMHLDGIWRKDFGPVSTWVHFYTRGQSEMCNIETLI